MAASADGFFTGLYADNQLVRTLPGGSVVWEAATGPGGTNGVALWGKIAITTNRDRGTITLHNAISGARLRELAVGGLPWGVAAANGRGYVANFGASTVSVIDLVEQKVLATVPVGLYPVSVAAGPDGAYVVHLDGSVTQLDSQGRILARASADAPDARGIAWDAIRERLYIGSREGHIIALDARTLQPVGRFTLPGPAYGLIVNPGTGRLYAVDAVNDRLYVVEPNGSGIAQIALPAQNASDGGMGLAAWNNRIVVTNYDAGSLTFVDDTTCAERLTPTAAPVASTATPTTGATPTATPTARRRRSRRPSPTATRTTAVTRAPTQTSTRTPTATATAETFGPRPTPATIRAKIEIVWPHGGASVREADLANITAYLISETNGTASSLLEPPACDWDPTVKLWAALNAQPARLVGVGQKRMATLEGRTFPVWDFNDVDVSVARDPANRLTFFTTVDGVRTLHNVWTHAADARTVFPQADVPTGTISRSPLALDGRIEIVWPHDNLPPEQARLANITAYLFALDTLQAIGPDASWTPTVRLHWSLNTDTEKLPGTGIVGVPRTITASNGVKFQAWDFNDVDISAARETLNKLYFWVSADDVVTFPNVWAHGVDARTVFPQPDVLNACR